jgi:hypothetical protein
MEEDKFWEILDITFADVETIETGILIKMDELEREKRLLIHDVQKKVKKEPNIDCTEMNQKIIDIIREYKDLRQQYI